MQKKGYPVPGKRLAVALSRGFRKDSMPKLGHGLFNATAQSSACQDGFAFEQIVLSFRILFRRRPTDPLEHGRALQPLDDCVEALSKNLYMHTAYAAVLICCVLCVYDFYSLDMIIMPWDIADYTFDFRVALSSFV